MLAALKDRDGAQVMAIDIGGDKLMANTYRVIDGTPVLDGEPVIAERTHGRGYLDLLTNLATLARASGIPVGVSYAGPMDGSRVLAGVNVPIFVQDLERRFNGDFKYLDPDIQVVNDAEAGLLAGAMEAVRQFPRATNVIYVINGSGIGCAVLRQGEVITTEAGHVEIDRALNLFAQDRACGLLGAQYVCLERVGASKAGVEDIWASQRGARLSGREIAKAYQAGDELALRLYDASALVTAHIVIGAGQALGLLDDLSSLIVVGHGGAFQVPGYGERVRSIVAGALLACSGLLLTKDFSANACLDGAAIAGLTAAR